MKKTIEERLAALERWARRINPHRINELESWVEAQVRGFKNTLDVLHNTVNDMVEITIPHHKEWLRNHDERLKLLEEMLEEYSNDLDEGYGSLKDLFLKIASQINEDKHSEFIQDLVARVERLEDNFKVKIEKLVWSFQPVIKALFEAIEAQVREQEDNQCR